MLGIIGILDDLLVIFIILVFFSNIFYTHMIRRD